MNANVDLIVSAVDVFKQLQLEAHGKPHDHNTIKSFQELDECFFHHFTKCAAAERFVGSEDLFSKLTKASLALKESKVSFISTIRDKGIHHWGKLGVMIHHHNHNHVYFIQHNYSYLCYFNLSHFAKFICLFFDFCHSFQLVATQL